jgi:hypothetical protein
MENAEDVARQLQQVRGQIDAAIAARRLPGFELDDQRLILERRLASIQGEEYAEPLDRIQVVVGFDWWVHAGFGSETLLACGLQRPQGEENSVLFRFGGVVETHFGGINDEVLDAHPLYGKGMDVCGFFIVRNSSWKATVRDAMSRHDAYDARSWDDVTHYLFRDKPGELSCLAKTLEWQVSALSLARIRDHYLSIWRGL